MPTISTDALVAQLHRALVDALILSDRHSVHDPVTVAEIYTDLIPYRSVRTLGFAMNADYEHALMHLLAGEGGFAQIEPDEVREQLRDELKSTNPNVGIYRNYAACDVLIALPDGLDLGDEVEPLAASASTVELVAEPVKPVDRVETSQIEAALQAEAELEPDTAIREFTPRAELTPERAPPAFVFAPASPSEDTVAEAEPEAEAELPPAPGAPDLTETHCIECDRELPSDRTARFCPYCGADQSAPKCANCKEELEKGWKFCIACGAAAE